MPDAGSQMPDHRSLSGLSRIERLHSNLSSRAGHRPVFHNVFGLVNPGVKNLASEFNVWILFGSCLFLFQYIHSNRIFILFNRPV